MKTYDVGDMVRLTASFTNEQGEPADPDTVVLRIRKGDGSVLDVDAESIAYDEPGEYHYDVEPDRAGKWTYSFDGTGTIDQSATGEFYVRETVPRVVIPTASRTVTHRYGDTWPPLRTVLRNTDGALADLEESGTEVALLLRPIGENTVHIFGGAPIEGEIGVVEYDWSGEETLLPWTYEMSWRVTYEDGTVQTFPASGTNRLIVRTALEEESSS